MLTRCSFASLAHRSRSCGVPLLALILLACGGSVQRNACPDGSPGPGCPETPDAGAPPDGAPNAAPPDAAPPEAAPDPGIRECPGRCSAQGRYCDTRRGECVECIENTDCPNHKALCQAGTCVECPLPESCGTSCCDPEAWVRQMYGWACVRAADIRSPQDSSLERAARRAEATYCDPRADRIARDRDGVLRGLANRRLRLSPIRLAECRSSGPQNADVCLHVFSGTQKAGQPCGSRLECERGVCEQPASCEEGVCADAAAGLCLDSEIRFQGKCVSTKVGDACLQPGFGAPVCSPGLTCDGGRCAQKAQRGEPCGTRACADQLDCNPVGNLCSALPADGQPCAGTHQDRCAAGHDCVSGTCRARLAAGEPCSSTTARCRPGLRCHNQTCLPLAYHGDPCGTDVVCVHGTTCRPPLEHAGAPPTCVGGPYERQPCDAATICTEGACVNGVCTPAQRAESGYRSPNPCGRERFVSAGDGTCRASGGEKAPCNPEVAGACTPGFACKGQPSACALDCAGPLSPIAL